MIKFVNRKIDTRFSYSRPLFENLDERWLDILTESNQEKILIQVYNRGGVIYESYDEMLVEILPRKFENKSIERKLKEYFIEKEKRHNGFSTLYLEALTILSYEVDEEIVKRFINCKDNAVNKYSLKVVINNFTNWSNKRKLDFYQKLPSKLVLKEEINRLKSIE